MTGTRLDREEIADSHNLLGMKHDEEPWKDRLPRLIFVSDMGDAFSSKKDFEFLEEDVVPHFQSDHGRKHLWLWLTKRPHMMADFAKRIGGFPENVCAMTTLTEGDKSNLNRLNDLKEVEAPIRGLSVEPLWARMDPAQLDLTGIDWLILGGESGSGREYTRDFHLEWAEELRAHCERSGVAFFLKQLGRNPVWKNKRLAISDPHGGEWDEWPEQFRVREFPRAFHTYRKSEMVSCSEPRPSTAKEAAPANTLSREEKSRFVKLNNTVASAAKAFVEAGVALYEIRSEKLYRAKFATFEDYCQSVHEISRQYANSLIRAGKTYRKMETIVSKTNADLAGQLPKLLRNEGRLRELTRLPDTETQVDVLEQVIRDPNNGRITSTHLRQVVDERLNGRPPAVAKTPTPRERIEGALALLDEFEEAINAGGQKRLRKALKRIREVLQGGEVVQTGGRNAEALIDV